MGETNISYDFTMIYGPPKGHSMDSVSPVITFPEEGDDLGKV